MGAAWVCVQRELLLARDIEFMQVLICERLSGPNEYIANLAAAYSAAGHTTVTDVENFLFSSFMPDVVHLHWPEAIYSWRHRLPRDDASLALIDERLSWYRRQGAVIVYTVHNLHPHVMQDPEWEEEVYRRVVRGAQIIVHHGPASIDALVAQVPECATARHLVAPHGAYAAESAHRAYARRHFGLPENGLVVLNFGRQLAYKGGGFCAQVVREAEVPGVHLFTIGKPQGRPAGSFFQRGLAKILAWLSSHLSNVQHVTEVLGAVPAEEVPQVMAATDVVLLGHQSGVNSGVLTLAASYAKPVVYPGLGNFAAQLRNWDWAEPYAAGDVTSAAKALETICRRLAAEESVEHLDNTQWLACHQWRDHVAGIEQAVLQVRAESEPS